MSVEYNFSNIETLIKGKGHKYADKWNPTTVSAFEVSLSQGSLKGMKKNLKKNIAYSLQYLQYIHLQLAELNLHSVVITLLYKTYIITGVSVVEALFYHLLKSQGQWRQKEWELDKVIKSNPMKYEGLNRRFETHIYKEIPCVDDEMTLDSMIKKIESNHLISIPHEAFPYIKMLKRLRNKVHLQIEEGLNDTDWYTFSHIDFLWMKFILRLILTNEFFGDQNSLKNTYGFLKLSESEYNMLKREIKKKK